MLPLVTVAGLSFNAALMTLGIVLLLAGWLMWRWSARHDLVVLGMETAKRAAIDAVSAARKAEVSSTDATGPTARARADAIARESLKAAKAAVPEELDAKLRTLQGAASNTERGKIAAGMAARGAAAWIVGKAAIMALLGGTAATVAAFVMG